MFRKRDKFAIAVMAAASAAVVAAPVVSAASSAGFTDVPKSNVHYDSIMKMKDLKFIEGNKGKFLPYEHITRGQVSVILTRALDLDPDVRVIAGKYKDVNSNNGYAGPVAAMTKAGIFSGTGGYFYPYKNITREQMASVLVKAFRLDQVKANPVVLSDKKISPSHRANVQMLANLGVTKETKNFRAFEPISREQFATMVVRAMEAGEDAKHELVFSDTYKPRWSSMPIKDIFVSKSGVLVSEIWKKTATGLRLEITALDSKGKIFKWSEDTPASNNESINVYYASDQKGKEALIVENQNSNKLLALDLSLKKLWEYKFKDTDYVSAPDGADGSVSINSVSNGLIEKITLDGEKVKSKGAEKKDPAVRRVGDFEYRINTEDQTYEKYDLVNKKVVWSKRAFDLDIQGEKTKPEHIDFMRPPIIDDKGNAYVTVYYKIWGYHIFAVSNEGNLLWQKDGMLTSDTSSARVFGDVLYYSPGQPEWDDFVANDYSIALANKITGEEIKTYGPIDLFGSFDVLARGKNLYVRDKNFTDAFNKKGEIVWSYKAPKGRKIYSGSFDNENNYYIASGPEWGQRDRDGWVFTYSEDGKLLSKKGFDSYKYGRFIVDPTQKQHYLVNQTQLKNGQVTVEVYKFNE